MPNVLSPRDLVFRPDYRTKLEHHHHHPLLAMSSVLCQARCLRIQSLLPAVLQGSQEDQHLHHSYVKELALGQLQLAATEHVGIFMPHFGKTVSSMCRRSFYFLLCANMFHFVIFRVRHVYLCTIDTDSAPKAFPKNKYIVGKKHAE